jgi:hypothetical protein
MRTILALLLLTSVAYADKPAELEKALARNRSLLVIQKADLDAANKAAVIAFGPANAKMFSVGYRKAGSAEKPTHYVASVRLSPAEVLRFNAAFKELLSGNKIARYEKGGKAKLVELELSTNGTAP